MMSFSRRKDSFRGFSLFILLIIFSSNFFIAKTQTNDCFSSHSQVFVSKLRSSENLTTIDTLKNWIRNLWSSTSSAASTNYSSCFNIGDQTKLQECLENQCLSADDILQLYNVTDKTSITDTELYELSPALLYLSSKDGCKKPPNETAETDHNKPSTGRAWGYGFLFVTIINVCSLAGALVMPFTNKSYYKQILLFMVGLAVGSLCANGLLVLIPEAMDLMYISELEIKDKYVSRACYVIGGIYLFFLIERILKMIFDWREKTETLSDDTETSHLYQKKKETLSDDTETSHLYQKAKLDADDRKNKGNNDHLASIKSKTPITNNAMFRDNNRLSANMAKQMSCPTLTPSSTFNSETPLEENYPMAESSSGSLEIEHRENDHGKRSNGYMVDGHGEHKKKKVATVAWMIIFGDGMHNFIDGLSIGAAFTDNIMAGISISIAVICEELPHELGDFAILLNAGMSIKKALMYNFLSACMCYLGLVVGTLLGENTSSHHEIFAIAGGMFLYISLVDMMPEMNSAAENEENKRTIGQVRIFILQNLGLIAGFGVILLMTLYGGDIDFGS